MKKFIFFFSFVFAFACNANAQFDTDLLFGGANLAFAKPVGDYSEYAKGGIAYTVIVGYSLTEKLGVGIEYGSAATVAFDNTLSTGLFGANIYGLNSYMAKGWYRFTEGTVKPYAAVGLGLAKVSEPDYIFTNSDGEEVTVEGDKRTGFGANAELGLTIKGFNLSYSFNMGGKGPKEPVFNEAVKDLALNYHRFAIGYIYNF